MPKIPRTGSISPAGSSRMFLCGLPAGGHIEDNEFGLSFRY